MPGDNVKKSDANQNDKVSYTSFHVPIEILLTRLKNRLEILSNNQQYPLETRIQMQEQANKVQGQIENIELMAQLKDFEKKNFSC